MHADLAGDGKQQRAEQDDGRNPFEPARKLIAPPGRLDMIAARSREKPDWVSAHAMPVAAPMINRMAPDSDAVSTSIGQSRRQSKRR